MIRGGTFDGIPEINFKRGRNETSEYGFKEIYELTPERISKEISEGTSGEIPGVWNTFFGKVPWNSKRQPNGMVRVNLE